MAEFIYDKYKSIFDSVINGDTKAEYSEPKSLFSNPKELVYPSDELFKHLTTRINDTKDTSITPEASGDEAQPQKVIAEPKGPKKFKKPRQRKNQLPPKQLVMEEGSTVNTNKQSVISKKKSMRDLALALQKERIDSHEGTWVECCDPKCRKFRYLDEIKEPWQVPKMWFCSMNKDLDYNSCDAPEEDNTSTNMVFNKFTAGSIVWAKIIGYPWWPAMVDDDPDILNFYHINDGLTEEPSHYHVVYLDDKVSRSWVSVSEIKPFSKDKVFSSICGGKDYRNEMKPAFKRAMKGLAMTLGDRLRKYSFVSNYKGKFLSCPDESEDIEGCNKSQEIKNVDNPQSKTHINYETTKQMGTNKKFKKSTETIENLRRFNVEEGGREDLINSSSKKVKNVTNKISNFNQKAENAERTVNFTKKAKTISQKAENTVSDSEKFKTSLNTKKTDKLSKKTEKISKKKLSNPQNVRNTTEKKENDQHITTKSESDKIMANVNKKPEDCIPKVRYSKKMVSDNEKDENCTRKIDNTEKMVDFNKKTKMSEYLTINAETNPKAVNTLNMLLNPSKATENASETIPIHQTRKISQYPLKTVENTSKMIQNPSKLIKNNNQSTPDCSKNFPSFTSFNFVTCTPVTQKFPSPYASQSFSHQSISKNATPESVYRDSLAFLDQARERIRILKRMNDLDTTNSDNEDIESAPLEIPDHMRKQFEDLNELSEVVQALGKKEGLREIKETGEHSSAPDISLDQRSSSNVETKIQTEKMVKKRSKPLVTKKSNNEMICKRSASLESVDKTTLVDVKNSTTSGDFKKMKTHVQGERKAKKPIFLVKRKSSSVN